MAKKPKTVLDTNILVSAIVYGGKPRQILSLVLENKTKAVTSSILLAELTEILSKKFKISPQNIKVLEKQIKKKFIFVQPSQTIEVLKDEPDNRVLEAAVCGNCSHIVTGDKELLALKSYKNIKIVTAVEFLNLTNIP